MKKVDTAGWYLILPNSVIFHPTLSLEAKGLLAYIAAKPENWAFCARRMAQELNCSEWTIKKYRKTLENTLVDESNPDSGYILSKAREQSGFVRYFVNFPSVKIWPDKIWPDKFWPDKIWPNNKEKIVPLETVQSTDNPEGVKEEDKAKPLALQKKRKNWWTAGKPKDEPEESQADKRIRLKSYEWIRNNDTKAEKLLQACIREIRNGSESASYVNPRDIERMGRELRMRKLKERFLANTA